MSTNLTAVLEELLQNTSNLKVRNGILNFLNIELAEFPCGGLRLVRSTVRK